MSARPALGISFTRRMFERTGLPTVWVGIALGTGAFLVFLTQELLLGHFASVDERWLEGVRLTFTHIAVVAYLLTAYVYCEKARDESLEKLRPLLDPQLADPILQTHARDRAMHFTVAVFGIAAAVLISLYLSPNPGTYDPRDWNSENGWHRVLSILMGLWTSRLSMLIIIESGRLSDLASALREIDLLDPEEVAPFVRRGLTNALVVIGMVSTYALFLADAAYLNMVASLLVLTLAVGGVALLLPLRGVRNRLRAAKRAELTWCHEKLRAARAELATGGARSGELQEIVAWERRVNEVNEWPVSTTTFTRFALYLLIPIGSWAGGALVERLVDALLD